MDDKNKKQIPLRISPQLYDDIAKWASDEFRSVNGQIEYLLTECVKHRKRGKGISMGPGKNFSAEEEKTDNPE